jgi:hypothetical protein
MWPRAPRGPLPSLCPPGPQQQHHHWPAPAPHHSPPPPQHAFLGGPTGSVFGGPGAHGGLLPTPPGFLPGPALSGVPGLVGFSGPLPSPSVVAIVARASPAGPPVGLAQCGLGPTRPRQQLQHDDAGASTQHGMVHKFRGPCPFYITWVL